MPFGESISPSVASDEGRRTGDVQRGSGLDHQAPWTADVEELARVVHLYAERRGVVGGCLAVRETC